MTIIPKSSNGLIFEYFSHELMPKPQLAPDSHCFLCNSAAANI